MASIARGESQVPSSHHSYVPPDGKLKLRKLPGYIKWVCAILCLISGVFSAYAFKIQNKQSYPTCDGCESKQFSQATIQAGMMFFAEALALLLFFIDTYFSRRAGKTNMFDFTTTADVMNPNPPTAWWWWVLPSMFDVTASICINVSITLTYASTVTMLRNFMVVVVAITQMIVLRRPLRVYEWIGIVFITAAMFLAATPAIQHPDSTSVDSSKSSLGIFLAIFGTATQSFQIVFEEFIFRRGPCSTMRAVGIEGCSGMVYTAIVLPIMEATKFELPSEGFYQLFRSGPLIGVTAAYIVAALVFNVSGLGTTKTGGGLLRAVIFAVRAPLVWLLDLANKWIDFDYYNLASVFVFFLGFFLYIGLYPKIVGSWAAAPVPCFCTSKEVDLDAPAGSDRRKSGLESDSHGASTALDSTPATAEV